MATVHLGPVVWMPVSAKSTLNFNLGFFFFSSKVLFRIIFYIFFRVSNNQIVGTVFSLNVSSAGKWPFKGGKAKKNVCQKHTFLGEGVSGVRDMAMTLLWNLGAKFSEMSYPHLRPIYTNQPLLFLDKTKKRLIPIILHSLQYSRKAVYTLVHFHIFIHYLDRIRSQLAYFLKPLI